MERLNEFKKITKQVKNGNHSTALLKTGNRIMNELTHFQKQKKTEKWQEYVELIHKIETAKILHAPDACGWYKKLKKAITSVEDFSTIKEISLAIDDFTTVSKKHLQTSADVVTTNTTSVDTKEAIGLLHQFKYEMDSLAKEMETKINAFLQTCQQRMYVINNRLVELMKELDSLEKQFVNDQYDACTIYYGIKYYQELRQERRRLKQELFMYKKMIEYKLSVSPLYITNSMDAMQNCFKRFEIHNEKSNYMQYFVIEKKESLKKLAI